MSSSENMLDCCLSDLTTMADFKNLTIVPTTLF